MKLGSMFVPRSKQNCISALVAIALLGGCKHADKEKVATQPAPATQSSVADQHPAATTVPSPAASPTTSVISVSTKWKTIEELSYPLGAQRLSAHFILQLPAGYSDPGDFIRIRIQVEGQPEFVLDNLDGWIEYHDPKQKHDRYAKLTSLNLVHSKYLLMVPSTVNPQELPLVVLRSWQYASDAERLHVIGFHPSGQPITLLNTKLDLLELVDLDGDGNLEIAGRPCLSEEVGEGVLTYDPLHVYKVPHPTTSPAVLSLELSKAYNLKNYYGWAGPKCSEGMVVVEHPPGGGKPVILPVGDVEKLFAEQKM